MSRTMILLLFSFLTMPVAHGQLAFNAKESKIIKNINQEIGMIKGAKRVSINYEYRLFELYAERNKIIFEAENRQYIKNAIKYPKRAKISFFPISYKNYNYIHKFGLTIALSNPLFYANDQIYFTLAQISRDFHGDKYTKLYLKKALKITRNDKLKYDIVTGLAEYYFNKKKYKTASYYFKRAIKYNTPWTTKHLYNLAWCEHMRKSYEKSLRTLLEAYSYSNKKGYVNINEQILKSSVPFFVRTNQIQRGIDFYLKNSKDAIDYLYRMAKRTKKNGDWEKTLLIIDRSKHLLNPKQESYLSNIEFQLKTYKDFRKYSYFFELTQHIAQQVQNKEVIPSDNIIAIIEQRSEYLQKVQIGKFKLNKEINENTTQRIHQYFGLLKVINPEKICAYEYHHGEYYFFHNSYIEALKNYNTAINYCIKSKNKEYLLKDVNSLLGTANLLSKSQPKVASQNLLTGYNTYIDQWPKSPKTKQYTEEIFKIHHKDQNIKQMNKYLVRYIKSYSQEKKKIEAMLLVTIDYYIKKQDAKNISKVLNFVKKDSLPLSSSNYKKTTIALATILFDRIDTYKENDKKLEALQQIYKNPLYPKKIKLNTSLKIATLALQISDYKLYQNWIGHFISIADQNQFLKQKEIIFSTLQKTYLSGQLKLFYDLSLSLRTKCNLFTPSQRLYIVDGIKEYFIEAQLDKFTPVNIKKTILADSCTITPKNLTLITKDIYTHILMENNIPNSLKWAKVMNPSDITSLFSLAQKNAWYEAYNLLQNEKRIESNLKIFTSYVEQSKIDGTLRAINDYKKVRNELDNLANIQFQVPSPFKEDTFTARLETYIQRVTITTAKVEKNLSLIPSEVAVSLLEELINQYKNKANNLTTAKLPNLEKNYKRSIKSALKGIAKQFYRKSYKTQRIVKRSLADNKMRRKAAFWKGEIDDHLRELNKTTSFYITYDPQIGSNK